MSSLQEKFRQVLQQQDFTQVARVVREARKYLRLSQAELAERLHVTRATVSNWERGVHPPAVRELRTIAEYVEAQAAAEGNQSRAVVAERGPRYAAVPATIPPRAYKLIYDYTQLLTDAGVPEDAIEEARRLMSGQTFNTLRAHMIDDRDEEGWVRDVKSAWALIKSELRRQGFDL